MIFKTPAPEQDNTPYSEEQYLAILTKNIKYGVSSFGEIQSVGHLLGIVEILLREIPESDHLIDEIILELKKLRKDTK